MSQSISGPAARGTVLGAFFLYGALFLDRLAPLYVVALVARDLGVPSAAEGMLALSIGFGWAAAMPLVSATSGRVSDRSRLLRTAAAAAGFSIASAFAPNWTTFIVLRGLGGVAAASGSPAVTSLVVAVVPPARRGRDLGIVQSSTRIGGSLLSPLVVTAVTVTFGWRAALLVAGSLLIAGVVTLGVLLPGGSERRTVGRGGAVAPTPYVLRKGGQRDLALCAVGCVLLLAWLTILSQTSVELLVTWLTIDTATAGRLVAWFGAGSVMGALGIPIVSDRIGRRTALASAGLLGGLGGAGLGWMAMINLTPPAVVVAVLLILGGAAMGGLPLTISVIPAETVVSGDVGRALVWPIAAGELLGASAVPALAAVGAATFGRGTMVLVAGLFLLGLPLLAAGLHSSPPASPPRR